MKKTTTCLLVFNISYIMQNILNWTYTRFQLQAKPIFLEGAPQEQKELLILKENIKFGNWLQ